jgi:hypothetical protein
MRGDNNTAVTQMLYKKENYATLHCTMQDKTCGTADCLANLCGPTQKTQDPPER